MVKILIFYLSIFAFASAYTQNKPVISDADEKLLLSKFNEIIQTLNELNNFYKFKTDKCSLSYDKLQQLKDAIDDAMTNDDQSNAINCDFDDNNPDGSCAELIKMIQCGIDEMANAVKDAANDAGKLAALQQQYDELQKQYQKFIDDNANYISQGAQKQIDDLKKKLQEQKEYLDKVLNKLMQQMVENICHDLRDNEISDAVDEFVSDLDFKLNYDNMVASIVETAYNGDYIENSLQFMKLLPAEAYSKPGCDKLIDLMTQNDQLSSINLFIYYEMVAPDVNHTQRLQIFKNKLSDEYFKRVKVIASEILQENTDDMQKVMDSLTISKFFAEDIVREAYTDPKYYQTIMNAIPSMRPLYGSQCMGFLAIYDSMIEDNFIDDPIVFSFTFDIDVLLYTYQVQPPESDSETAYSKTCLKRLNDLKTKILPKTVHEIISNGDKCRITTVNGDGMMFADDQHAVNVKKFTDTSDDSALWKFEVTDDYLFEITNVHYDEKLAVDGSNVFTASDVDSQWVLYPHNNAMIMKIFNKNYGTDLVTNWKSSSDGESVKTTASSDDDYVWKISCD